MAVPEIEKFTAMIDALSYWLGYQTKIGRGGLIHEASFRYPIADAITAKDISIERVELERLHPIFKSKKIDLVIYDKLGNTQDDNLQEIFEFKLSKRDTAKEYGDEHQAVFDDVVRLAYYNKNSGKECYFLMCGPFVDFNAYFVNQQETVKAENGLNIVPSRQSETKKEWLPKGFYKDWFGFIINEEKEKEFTSNSEWGLKLFQKKYKFRDGVENLFKESFIKIKTRCMAITPYETDRSHAVGIWKIEASNSPQSIMNSSTSTFLPNPASVD